MWNMLETEEEGVIVRMKKDNWSYEVEQIVNKDKWLQENS